MRVQWIYHVLVLSRGFVFGCENYEMEWTGVGTHTLALAVVGSG
jgi:hypothetical protein